MSAVLPDLMEQALALSPPERAALADALLESLEPSDPEIDRAWLRVAQDRIAAYEAGQTEAIPVEEAMKEFDDL